MIRHDRGAMRISSAGGKSPLELTRFLIERIERLQPLNAITITGELALSQARKATRKYQRFIPRPAPGLP
jgi:hypothetical protein